MNSKIILLQCIFVFFIPISVYSQLNDFSPLNIGREFHYSYFDEEQRYKSPIYVHEDTYYKTEGDLFIRIVDSSMVNDSTIQWDVRTTLDYKGFGWSLNNLGVRETTYTSGAQTMLDRVHETLRGKHQTSFFISYLNLHGTINRYSDTQQDTILYRDMFRYAVPVIYVFGKDSGFIYKDFSISSIGNFSYYRKVEKVFLKSMVTKSDEVNSSVPKSYSIHNYPNPFNPLTKISYNIPEEGIVKISIYNSIGQLVCILIDEYQMRGSHSTMFDASGLNSGMYFCKLDHWGNSITHKLVLIK